MGRQGDRRPAGLRSPYLGHEQPGPGRPGGGKSPQNRLCARHDDSFFTALILLGMLTAGLLKFQIALAIGLACWAFFTFSALPSQFREWKAAEIAKSGLKEAGLWPVLPSDAMAVEQCLKALSWCHVAGFRRILPR